MTLALGKFIQEADKSTHYVSHLEEQNKFFRWLQKYTYSLTHLGKTINLSSHLTSSPFPLLQ